jgi:hypothetical protein
MRTRRRANIEDLRQAIDCLPRRTKLAMLDGIAGNEIIVGAYTSRDGICPMLAAHRAGGRTSLISFAKAWDRFAFRDSRSRRARRATERELLILRAHLEASLLAEHAPPGAPEGAHREQLRLPEGRYSDLLGLPDGARSDLAAARAEHEALVARRREQDARGAREGQDLDAGRRQPAPLRPESERHRPGDPSRTRELRHRRGWAWTRIVRRYDEYRRVLERLEAERTAAEPAASEREPTSVC